MKINLLALKSLVLFVWAGNVFAASPTKHYSLSMLHQIRPGISRKGDVLKLLGKPDRYLDFTHANPIKSDTVGWSYLEAPFLAEDRITVEFPTGSDVVQAVGWDVRKGEQERSLAFTKSSFHNVKFEMQKHPQINPHTTDNRFFFKNVRLGILILHDKKKDYVQSIERMVPSEVLRRTDFKNFQYPEFCIQDQCSRSSPEIERQLANEYESAPQ
ncbi:MAG: hypothetical protein HYZ71_07860 [Deltaproteobacteria bacterium]|nr:hypothetical protein [Deltaproteobacteria bacterium]